MKKVYPNNLLHAFLLILLLIAVVSAHGGTGRDGWLDNPTDAVETFRLFQRHGSEQDRSRTDLTVLELDRQAMDALVNRIPNQLDVYLEATDGKDWTLRLNRVRLLADDFKLYSINGSTVELPFEEGLYYRGDIAGKPGTIAVLSFKNGRVSGSISSEEGRWELVPLDSDIGSYELHRSDLEGFPGGFTCSTLEPPVYAKPGNTSHTESVACKTVKISVECDFKMYKDFQQNTAATADYVASLMNQVAAIYQNEDIDLQVQEIKIWSAADPYASINSVSEILTAFRNNRGSGFNGDLCHFMSTRAIGGGMAYLDVLCNKPYGYGVSSVLTSFNAAPSYSWSVEVVAHEIGHNFGSNHTHWCGWQRTDGSTGPLDNCYTSEGGCPAGPVPQNGGTVMSYCHLTSNGINFNKGFGTEPGNLIRQRLIDASCISSGGSVPVGTNTTSITASTARLNWSAVPNTISYEVAYRVSGTGNWTGAGTTTGTFLQLNQLAAGTNYEWRVKTGCSAFGNSVLFTTASASACATPTGLTISSMTGVSAVLTWQAVAGCSNYQLQYRKSGSTEWNTVNNIPINSCTLSALSGTTTYNWRVKTDCSNFSNTANFTTSSSGCPAPVTSAASNITLNGARLSWAASSGATSYVVSYKSQIESRWKSTSTSATQLSLTGLAPGTTYEWKIRSNCSNTSITRTFRTLSATSMPATNDDETGLLKVFPNPADARITVKSTTGLTDEKPVTVVITDVIGKVKMTVSAQGDETTLDISALPDGIYTVQWMASEGKAQCSRFVKRD